ncbi:ABC transporter substrate-binding protein [Desulfitibacter alkalitolerans]|uniref:ABC transporter substrate-binding protein n=1 Tax=Desulfitibacter alkalitolerans TaxID=264641 RepID=UPI00048840B9|nr:ABC transporter substrate-binding protein [Desulfitibacter alkalitolerans]
MLKNTMLYQYMILCAVIIFLVTGCTQLREPQEIIIGVAWPFGTDTSLFHEGINLAVNEINDSGGINGKKLKLFKEDDGDNLVKGMAIAQSFAENKSIQAVIGHSNSYISIPASATYNNAGIVMLSPTSTAAELTQNGYKHVFRNIPNDHEIARQLAIYLAELGHGRMVIYYSDDSYGRGLANSFEDHAASQGIIIVDRFNYYNGLEDLKHLHNRWKAFGFDGIFLAKGLIGGARFIADAGQAGIKVQFAAGDALDSPLLSEIGGTSAEGTIVGSVFNPYQDRPETQKFVADFWEEYNVMPCAYAALGYDAVKMLAAAIGNSDLLDPSTVGKELRNLGKWPGAVGDHEFNEQGDNTGRLVVLKKLHAGNFEYIKR